jgi:hypothetical protein
LPDTLGLWRRWWRLPGADKCIVLSAAWRLPWVDLSLRLRGLKRTRRGLLQGLAPADAGACSAAALTDAQRLAALVAIVGGYGGHATSCLRQALVVEQALRRRGLPATLRVGVDKGGYADFTAHAWVELDGVALAQSSLRHAAVRGLDKRL